MKIVHLELGSFENKPESFGSDVPNSLERKALLVYAGEFNSLDGPVTVNDEKIDKLVLNHNSLLSKIGRLTSGPLHLKNYPPVQLDHSTSAKDTVGRLVGNLTKETHTTEDGKQVPALYGTLKILGKENVEKVVDGRWTNLSLGVDFEEGKISELTITPFPAAPDASLMKKGDTRLMKEVRYKEGTIYVTKYFDGDFEAYIHEDYIPYSSRATGKTEKEVVDKCKQVIDEFLNKKGKSTFKGDKMFKKLMKYLTGFKKLSEDKAKEELAQMSDEEKQKLAQEAEEKEKVSMKKHLVEVEKMSEEDADKKLAEMKPEEKEELACKMKEHEEKLVGEAAQKEKDQRETQMSAFKEKVTRLSTELKGTSEKVRLAHKKTQLMTRFSKLRSEAKVTPAEIKKIDFDRLSKCNQETIDAVLKSYEDREMTIFTGALGTQKAMTHTQLQESLKGERMSALEAETRKNMPTKRMAEGDQKVGGEAAKEVEVHIDTAPHVAYEKEYEELSRLVDEDKKDEIKDKLKKLFEGLKKSGLASDSTSVPTEGEAEKQMASLAEDVKKLQSVVEELVKMTQATN